MGVKAVTNRTADALDPTKVRKQVIVPRLLEGKLGVKLKGGMYVVGFDHIEAKEFGWHLHDEIIEVNGKAVSDRDSFAKEYVEAKKKLPISFTVLRGAEAASSIFSAATTVESQPRKLC